MSPRTLLMSATRVVDGLRSVPRTWFLRCRAALLLALCSTVPGTVHAQSGEPQPLSSVTEGTRVRITPRADASGAPGGDRLIGTVREMSADSITFVAGRGSQSALAFSQVALLETSDGVRHRGKRGMLVGFLLGAGTMTALVLSEPQLRDGTAVAYFGAYGGAIGAAVGGLIGLAFREERWRPVAIAPRETRLSVSPMLGGGQRGIGLRVSW